MDLAFSNSFLAAIHTMTMQSKPAVRRCHWAQSPLMIEYHDTEWGVPLHDDRRLFEFLILEGAQAGLSWETILRKRENYRRAFDGFDAAKIARYDKRKVRALMADAGIVRNRLKIAATITNAQAFLAVQKEHGSFDRYIWEFVGGKPKREFLAAFEASACAHGGIRRDEQRPQEARISVRRLDDLLRLHAGDRDGQRSRHRLFPAPRNFVDVASRYPLDKRTGSLHLRWLYSWGCAWSVG